MSDSVKNLVLYSKRKFEIGNNWQDFEIKDFKIPPWFYLSVIWESADQPEIDFKLIQLLSIINSLSIIYLLIIFVLLKVHNVGSEEHTDGIEETKSYQQ